MANIHAIKTYLAARGIEVWQYAEPTPNADLAAAAVGCSLAEIAKTLLFLISGQPLVVVACGDMKVSSSLLKQGTGYAGRVRMPEADDVKVLTGYAPGGVCPFLLPAELPVYLDEALLRFEQVYAAAGDAASAVPIRPNELAALTGGRWVTVCTEKEMKE